MAFLSALFGKKPKLQQVPTLSPQQTSFLNQLFGQISPEQFQLSRSPLYQAGATYLQNLLSGKPEATQGFEAPARHQYEEEIVPQLAERFSGLGARNSSAFLQALARSGTDLATRLQALRSGLQMQALPQALGFAQAPSSLGLQLGSLGLGTSPFGYTETGGRQGFLGPLLGGALGGAAGGFGQLAGGALGNRLFSSSSMSPYRMLQ